MIPRVIIFCLFFVICFFNLQAQDFDITTIAGIDSQGYRGDGLPAIDCKLYFPEGISLDGWGNLYIADLGNERIRKMVLSTGIISTVAGNGTIGYTGDNILATNAELSVPTDVFADLLGNVYIADAGNNRVRKITVSTGIITTIAGNGSPGSLGDGGLATNAELNEPGGVCVDKFGNIYIADYLNNKVRKVAASTGVITTIAGNGTIGNAGVGGPATNAELNSPSNVFLDSLENVFIGDNWNHVIHKVDISTGIITNIAGTGTAGYSGNGGLAIHAELNQPSGGFFDRQGNLFFADYGNGAIRKIDGLTGIITTIAGNGTWGFSGDGGPATAAQLIPTEVLLDSVGIMYIADYDNNRIRMVYNPLAVKPLQSKNEITLYPNPAHDELTIGNAPSSKLVIYDVVGKLIYQTFISSGKQTVKMSGFPNGVYVVEIQDAAMNRITKKMVKE